MSTIDLKITEVKAWFSSCRTAEERYQKIIELGQQSKQTNDDIKIPENIVDGCQSIVYLGCKQSEGKLFFETASDALITSGLGVLLTHVYSGEIPEVILKSEPRYLEELGIVASLSPNRANGLYSLHLRMKQEALKRYSLQ